jgi:hypothetical protein
MVSQDVRSENLYRVCGAHRQNGAAGDQRPFASGLQARGEGGDAELSQLNATLLSLKGPCARIAWRLCEVALGPLCSQELLGWRLHSLPLAEGAKMEALFTMDADKQSPLTFPSSRSEAADIASLSP